MVHVREFAEISRSFFRVCRELRQGTLAWHPRFRRPSLLEAGLDQRNGVRGKGILQDRRKVQIGALMYPHMVCLLEGILGIQLLGIELANGRCRVTSESAELDLGLYVTPLVKIGNHERDIVVPPRSRDIQIRHRRR